MEKEKGNKTIQDDEIDLVALAQNIWTGRRFIAKVTGVFAIIGLVIAFTSSVEYEASCKLLPESQEKQMPNLGGLAGLAGLAGVDLGSMGGIGSGVLTPQLYPEIVNSLPFILELMTDSVYFEQRGVYTTPFYFFNKMDEKSWIEYVTRYTVGLPGLLVKYIKNQASESIEIQKKSDFYRFTVEEWKLIDGFKERLSIEIDETTGVIGVMVEMPDPYAAAELAKRIELMITDAVIKYKTDKSKTNLAFVEATFLESKNKFDALQYKLAQASDRNRNVSSALGKIQLERIQLEYNVAFEVYKGLASQVEQAKIKLKEETPVFTVLEPVRIPEKKSQPNRPLILVVSIVFGLIFSTIFTLVKQTM